MSKLSKAKKEGTQQPTSADNAQPSLRQSMIDQQDSSGDVQAAAGEKSSTIDVPINAKSNIDLALQLIKNMTASGKAIEQDVYLNTLASNGLDAKTARETLGMLFRAGLVYEPKAGYWMVL